MRQWLRSSRHSPSTGISSAKPIRRAFKAAYDEVEDEEGEHLYHTQGWCRELWLQSLGSKAVLPPPKEKKGVKTAGGAETAREERLLRA
jgi:hypothetical protein